jgi:uncharacterized membrane protein YgdD (TMEM256/DUF423 family)
MRFGEIERVNLDMSLQFFDRKISKDQSRDTGMAMVLLLLIVTASRRREGYLFAAMALHILNMTVPQIYRPVAVIWLGISDLIGSVVSRVLLSIVFVGVVTPIGMFRRLIGRDSLKLRAFKAGKGSVMLERNHTFVDKDLQTPF